VLTARCEAFSSVIRTPGIALDRLVAFAEPALIACTRWSKHRYGRDDRQGGRRAGNPKWR
jgi:hypothetical protein